jgi:hypothetical protein
VSFSGAALTMSGTGGVPNATYCLLTATNLSLPVTNWTRTVTNQFDASGNFSLTLTNGIDPNRRQLFYRVQLQ